MPPVMALALRSSACSLTGDAKEFFISGFGVICIDMKYLPPVLALGLTCGELISFFLAGIIGTDAPLLSIEVSFSSFSGAYCRLTLDLQIMVFTMKFPETDFVLVIDLAALKNTFDFFTDLVLFSLAASSTCEVLALHCKEPGFYLNGFLRCSETGMATVS